MMKCHNNPKFQNKYAFIEMKKRGFIKETIENFKIGLFDGSIKKYMDTTYSKDDLQKAGFINKKGNWSFDKRIVYPYLDQNNKPKYFIYRLIDSKPDFNKEAKYIKQIKTIYVKEIPFGLNSIYTLRKKPLIITEGMTDAISVIQANYPCLSPITVRIKKLDIEKMINYCKRFKKVVVINDNEKLKKDKDGEKENTGLRGAIDTLKVLIKHNIICFIGIIPNPEKLEKVDLDDYLKPDLKNIDDIEINTVIETSLKSIEERLNELIQQTIPGIDFLINTINEKSSQDDLIEILEILPENDFITQEDVFKKLAKKRKVSLEAIRKIYKQYQDDKLLKEQKREELEKQKEIEKKNIEEKDEKKEISAVVRESDAKVHEVICTKYQLIYRESKEFYNRNTLQVVVKTFDTIIIDEPFYLENIYYSQNLELFYEVKIGNETICYNKRDLLDFIENERC
ncbi:MAG TPA: hypothetical protein VMZ91_03210, partial [Candidatus Paceibacterota bacterium]|nr:hypothetical protein [Candidatus Paceibacterota bacterium]